MRQTFILILILAGSLPPEASAADGLAVRVQQGTKHTSLVLPYAAIHVPGGREPAGFPGPGSFTAEFSGFISVDLRAQYTFTVELDGRLELLINEKEVLNVDVDSESSHTSKRVRLGKGTNSFVARFTAPADRPATLRIYWSSRNNAVPVPIPPAALSHEPAPELTESLAAGRGAFLFDQYRCAKCHLVDSPSVPDLLDAPALEGIGSRLNREWMARWILDPSAHREARMPGMFHGPDALGKSQAIAAFLSLSKSAAPPAFEPTETLRVAGETIFADLRCASCHTPPGEARVAGRFSLDHVGAKFVPAALPEFLRNPHAHYRSNPMPNFNLSSDEARALAAFLLRQAPVSEPEALRDDLAVEGKSLLQTSGCLNCHAFDLPNRFTAPTFADLGSRASSEGCLDANSQTMPRFAFAPGERDDIKAFLSGKSSGNLALADVARHTRALRCAQCHEDAGLPPPLALGGKLRPEWSERFIAGGVDSKPRPWLKARMPSFPASAGVLASGLAALHGYPAVTPHEPALRAELVSTGAKLVSVNGGFSCVACHSIGDGSAAPIVESPGINLTFSGERLQPSFFHRWLMNPIAMDPATKMPAYFDAEARSQLIEFFDGDAHQQIDAIWQYIRSLKSE